MQEFNQRGEMEMGGWNIGKLVFWRDVGYSPKLTSLWKKRLFTLFWIRTN
jgi:hypothetical protein